MSTELVLAVDVGTTWCKAAYLDRQGQAIAAGRAYTREIVMDCTTTLERFWLAFTASIQSATAQLAAPIAPAAIGISSRALFGVCMDEAGRWSLPAWDAQLDRRTSPDMLYAYSKAVWGEQDPFAFGYGVGVGALLRWLQRTRPTAWRQIQRIGALHDYLLFRMTGAWVTNPTTGPGETGWPPEILAMSGLPHTAFPQVLQPHEIAGKLTVAAGQMLGLPAGIPVVVGTHDGAAANLGVGAVEPGHACLTLGSNLVLRVITSKRLETGCFSYLIAPSTWSWVGNVPGASRQLDVVAESLCPDPPNVAACHQRLGQQVALLAPGIDGPTLQMHPPSAERAMQQAVFHARQAGHSDATIYRALLGTVALGVRKLVQRARSNGAKPQQVLVTGGHAQNTQFLRVLAALLDRPLTLGPIEGGVIGAGMIAATGAGWYQTWRDAVRAMAPLGMVIEPDSDHGL